MTRVNIVVEGQTEETFVRNVLAPYLGPYGVFIIARKVLTSKRGSRYFRGGLANYSLPKRDIEKWLAEDSTAWLTTMFDFYRLPSDFPGYGAALQCDDPYEAVSILEKAMKIDLGSQRVLPYIQLHEFEAYLFSDVTSISAHFFEVCGLKEKLEVVRSSFLSPEHINSDPDLAPSKRLIDCVPGYGYLKASSGPIIAGRIGIDTIRRECPHFDSWIKQLLAVGGRL